MKILGSMLLLVVLCIQVFAADAPAMPAPPLSLVRGAHAFVLGPADSTGGSRRVRGSLLLLANVPRDVQVAEVEMFVDNMSIGTTNTKPYKIEYDSFKIADGEHVLKAVARNSSGAEVWSASAKVLVGNNGVSMPSDRDGGPGSIEKPTAVPQDNLASAGSLQETTYRSDKYGLTIKHPIGWHVEDKTSAMKSKSSDEFWLVFGAPPVVVNIHCKKLAPGTNANIFAKYNTYVQSWERRAIADSPAFVTTDGKPELKRIVHRVIFIKDGSAWMANCIDTTGRPSAETATLLENMLESIQPTRTKVRIMPVH